LKFYCIPLICFLSFFFFLFACIFFSPAVQCLSRLLQPFLEVLPDLWLISQHRVQYEAEDRFVAHLLPSLGAGDESMFSQLLEQAEAGTCIHPASLHCGSNGEKDLASPLLLPDRQIWAARSILMHLLKYQRLVVVLAGLHRSCIVDPLS